MDGNIWMDSPLSRTQLQFYSLGNFNQKITLNLKRPAVLCLSPLTIIYINYVKLIASNDQGKNFLLLSTYFSNYLYCAALFRKLSSRWQPLFLFLKRWPLTLITHKREFPFSQGVIAGTACRI